MVWKSTNFLCESDDVDIQESNDCIVCHKFSPDCLGDRPYNLKNVKWACCNKWNGLVHVLDFLQFSENYQHERPISMPFLL